MASESTLASDLKILLVDVPQDLLDQIRSKFGIYHAYTHIETAEVLVASKVSRGDLANIFVDLNLYDKATRICSDQMTCGRFIQYARFLKKLEAILEGLDNHTRRNLVVELEFENTLPRGLTSREVCQLLEQRWNVEPVSAETIADSLGDLGELRTARQVLEAWDSVPFVRTGDVEDDVVKTTALFWGWFMDFVRMEFEFDDQQTLYTSLVSFLPSDTPYEDLKENWRSLGLTPEDVIETLGHMKMPKARSLATKKLAEFKTKKTVSPANALFKARIEHYLGTYRVKEKERVIIRDAKYTPETIRAMPFSLVDKLSIPRRSKSLLLLALQGLGTYVPTEWRPATPG
jgi:hypothetical protein